MAPPLAAALIERLNDYLAPRFSCKSEYGIRYGKSRIGQVVLVVSLVQAFVVVPIDVGRSLHQQVRFEHKVGFLRLDGEPFASGQGIPRRFRCPSSYCAMAARGRAANRVIANIFFHCFLFFSLFDACSVKRLSSSCYKDCRNRMSAARSSFFICLNRFFEASPFSAVPQNGFGKVTGASVVQEVSVTVDFFL